MTLHSKTCSIKYIERKPATLYEKTCLSVCRRQCPIEQGDLLERDRGDPVSTETQKHRLGLCSTIKKSKFLQNAWQELSTRISSSSSRRRSTTSSRTIVTAKFGITWSSSKKSHWNGRVKEVSEFYIRHHCKTKISRGSEHYIGTFWPNTGIAEWSKFLWTILRISRMLNQFAVEIPTLPVVQCHSHLIQFLKGC